MSEATRIRTTDVRCSLPQESQAERRKQLGSGIMGRIRRVRELPDGYAFGLELSEPDEAAAHAFESECCGFASYQVERDAAQSAIWLSVRGPGGAKDFVKQLVPDSVAVEPCAHPSTPTKSLLRGGLTGAGAALFALICCATPVLGIALGAVGLGAAVAAAGFWLDVIAAPVLLASLAVMGAALWPRWRQRTLLAAAE